jgi:hypothetical protein
MSENVGSSTSCNPKGLHRDNFTFIFTESMQLVQCYNVVAVAVGIGIYFQLFTVHHAVHLMMAK